MWSEPSGLSRDSLTSLRTLPGGGRELGWISPGLLLALEIERVLWEAGRALPTTFSQENTRNSNSGLNLPQFTYWPRHCHLCAGALMMRPLHRGDSQHPSRGRVRSVPEVILGALTRHVGVEGNCYKVQLPREASRGFSRRGLVLS